jgi:hypothetical protein
MRVYARLPFGPDRHYGRIGTDPEMQAWQKDPLGVIAGSLAASMHLRRSTSLRFAVMRETVGSAFVGSNPTAATTKPQVRHGVMSCCLLAEGAV